ncbi:hypothetical protein ACT44U_06890 [Acinetobacter baumannii]
MENKNYHWLILLVILFAVIAAWLSFPIFFEWLITKHFLIDPEKYGQKFGAVGDTYGSLNTLISSIALCAVAYSTWLQVTSLNETREINTKQLRLAKLAHDEQVKESRNAIFANKFYGLLNYKNEKLNQIKILYREDNNFKEISGLAAFDKLSSSFCQTLGENPNFYENKPINEINEHFKSIVANDFNNNVNALISYLFLYADLINLIKESDIDERDKTFYRNTIRNSMFQSEQIVYFWLSIFYANLYSALDSSHIFNQFYDEYFFKFALRFHNESHFFDSWWKKIFIKSN